MRRSTSVFSILPYALVFAGSVAACSGETLDAGTNTPSLDGGSVDSAASRAPETSVGSGSPGSTCETADDCAAGLSCLGFAVHPQGEPCRVDRKACTIACQPIDDDNACAALGPTYRCFGGCSNDYFCGATSMSGETTIEVTDASAKLTSNPGDALFSIKLTRAPKPIAASALLIDAGIAGTTATVMLFTHDDTNDNGMLDVGESLDCNEPPKNVFDETTVGKTVNVALSERDGKTTYTRARGVWNP